MYRRYENPRMLEDQLAEARKSYKAISSMENPDWDALESIAENIHDLKERINFAWQDDEYEVEGEW